MTTRIFSCQCGYELSIRETEAGAQLTCPQCQASVFAPSLRDLKNLPLATAAPAGSRFAFLPERRLPPSPWRFCLGVFFLAVALLTPVMISLGLLQKAFSRLPDSDPRRRFFELDNPALWGGLLLLSLAGVVALLRGQGYQVGGVSRNNRRP